MKNSEIIALVKEGILSMTSHGLPAQEAYKAVKLKMEIHRAFNALSEAEKNVLYECGIDDVEKHNARQRELSLKSRRTDAEQTELAELIEKTRRANNMTMTLRNEEAVLDVKPLDFDTWRILQSENRAVKIEDRTVDILGGIAELLLHGVFWMEPRTAEDVQSNNV